MTRTTVYWVGNDGALHSRISDAVIPPNPPVLVGPTAVLRVSNQTNLTVAVTASASTAVSPAKISTYAWTFGDGATATGVSPTHTYAAAGTYNIVLTVTDSNALSNSSNVTVKVTAAAPANKPPTLDFTSSTMDGLTFEFVAIASDPDGTIASGPYWNFGDGGAGGPGYDVFHTYATGGTFSVRCAVVDNSGAETDTTHTVSALVAPTPALTLTQNGMTTAADASKSVAGTYPIAKYMFDWGDGAKVTQTGSQATHTYTALGPWPVVVTVYDTQGNSTLITRQAIPVAASTGGGHVWDNAAGSNSTKGFPDLSSQYVNLTSLYTSGNTFQDVINKIPSGQNKILVVPNGFDLQITNFNASSNSGFFPANRLVGMVCLDGPGQARVYAKPGSLTAAQQSHLNGLTSGSTDFSFGYFGNGGSDTTHTVYVAGITFESGEQGVNKLGGLSVYHAYANPSCYIQYCRFIGVGVSSGESPPSETAALGFTGGSGVNVANSEIVGAFRKGTEGPGAAAFIDPVYDLTQRKSGGLAVSGSQNVLYSNVLVHETATSGITFSLAGSYSTTSTANLTSNVVTYGLQSINNDNHVASPASNGFPGVNHEVVVGSVVHNNPTVMMDNTNTGQGHFSWIGGNSTSTATLRINGGTFSTRTGFPTNMLVVKSNYSYTPPFKWGANAVTAYNNAGQQMTMYTSAAAAVAAGATKDNGFVWIH